MEDIIIRGLNFRLMCQQQNMLARYCWDRRARRKYLKGKEEKRRVKERKNVYIRENK